MATILALKADLIFVNLKDWVSKMNRLTLSVETSLIEPHNIPEVADCIWKGIKVRFSNHKSRDSKIIYDAGSDVLGFNNKVEDYIVNNTKISNRLHIWYKGKAYRYAVIDN